MNINELSKILTKYRIYIVIFGVVVSEIIFGFIFFPPMIKNIQENFAKKDLVNLEIAELTTVLDSLAKINKENLGIDLSKAGAALPDQKKTAGLVTGLSNLALTSGVTVKNLEFSPGLISSGSASLEKKPTEDVIKGGGVKAVIASMTVLSDLDSLVDFLSKMDKASQLLGVSDVMFGHDISSGSQAKIGLYIYYQPLVDSVLLAKQILPLTETENKVLQGLSSKDIFILQ